MKPLECSGGFGLEAQQGPGSDPGDAQEVWSEAQCEIQLAMPGTAFREPVACGIFRNIKSNK